MVFIKGHEIAPPVIKDSFERRAIQIENNIILTLKSLGLESYMIKVHKEKFVRRKLPASVTWYFQDRKLKYSYALMPKFVENLFIIDKILKIEVARLLSKEILPDDFIREFSEDEDLIDQRIEARKTLCLKPDEMDIEVVNKNYKHLAKKYHPDMPNGDHESFQKINVAHKLLKKELT